MSAKRKHQKPSKHIVNANKSNISNAKGSLLTAAEACKFLGIKPQTLYAYVSRGQLRAESQQGKHGHLYPLSDLEMLLARSRARSGHGAAAASAMRWGEAILDSAITCIQGDMVYYRGTALCDLLRKRVAFENVAEMLWSGDLPSQTVIWPGEALHASPKYSERSHVDDSGAFLARRMLFRVSELALTDREGCDELMDVALRRARRLIMATVNELFVVKKNRLVKDHSSLRISELIALGLGLENSNATIHGIDAALIASADHELNASTFAARVAASTGADLYSCILAGVAAFSGRNHGLSPVKVYDFITELSRLNAPETYLASAIEAKELIPGFGHRLYLSADPRAEPLLAIARNIANEQGGEAQRKVDILFDLISAARAYGLQFPNLDLGLVAIAFALGLSNIGASSLFITGRIAGWTAHILEQRQQRFLLRPRARYIGRSINLER